MYNSRHDSTLGTKQQFSVNLIQNTLNNFGCSFVLGTILNNFWMDNPRNKLHKRKDKYFYKMAASHNFPYGHVSVCTLLDKKGADQKIVFSRIWNPLRFLKKENVRKGSVKSSLVPHVTIQGSLKTLFVQGSV